jgi:DNA-binding winged helix-turn-helix (wHTH) protein
VRQQCPSSVSTSQTKAPREAEIFAFGDCVLDRRERLLLRDGTAVSLTAKAFDLLVALVRRSGHLVTKEELLQEVWPGRFVEEVNLSVNISAIRKARCWRSNGTPR